MTCLKLGFLRRKQWLLSLPVSDDRELCLAFIYELDKHKMSNLPQTELSETYEAYTTALSEALDGKDYDRRHFFQLSVHHFAYIEYLLSRIGLIAIRQIITKIFIDTLGKGITLITVSVLTLVAASYWFSPENRAWLLATATFFNRYSIPSRGGLSGHHAALSRGTGLCGKVSYDRTDSQLAQAITF